MKTYPALPLLLCALCTSSFSAEATPTPSAAPETTPVEKAQASPEFEQQRLELGEKYRTMPEFEPYRLLDLRRWVIRDYGELIDRLQLPEAKETKLKEAIMSREVFRGRLRRMGPALGQGPGIFSDARPQFVDDTFRDIFGQRILDAYKSESLYNLARYNFLSTFELILCQRGLSVPASSTMHNIAEIAYETKVLRILPTDSKKTIARWEEAFRRQAAALLDEARLSALMESVSLRNRIKILQPQLMKMLLAEDRSFVSVKDAAVLVPGLMDLLRTQHSLQLEKDLRPLFANLNLPPETRELVKGVMIEAWLQHSIQVANNTNATLAVSTAGFYRPRRINSLTPELRSRLQVLLGDEALAQMTKYLDRLSYQPMVVEINLDMRDRHIQLNDHQKEALQALLFQHLDTVNRPEVSAARKEGGANPRLNTLEKAVLSDAAAFLKPEQLVILRDYLVENRRRSALIMQQLSPAVQTPADSQPRDTSR